MLRWFGHPCWTLLDDAGWCWRKFDFDKNVGRCWVMFEWIGDSAHQNHLRASAVRKACHNLICFASVREANSKREISVITHFLQTKKKIITFLSTVSMKIHRVMLRIHFLIHFLVLPSLTVFSFSPLLSSKILNRPKNTAASCCFVYSRAAMVTCFSNYCV